MAAAGQNEIYKLLMEFNGKLGDIGATVRALADKVDLMAGEMHESESKSDVSRANVHRRLDEMVDRIAPLEASHRAMRSTLDEMQSVTEEVVVLRERARGAGTLGTWLLRIGIGVVSFAGWAVGLYTWWTGKPPP